MKKNYKPLKSTFVLFIFLLLAFALMGCSKKNNNSGIATENQFTWWITRNDSAGQLYDRYEDNVAVQWLNNQYWDSEKLTLASDENGKKMNFNYQVPIIGAETDNFNTMISTGEYPEIVDLAYAGQSPRQLYEDGVLMDITEYVEKYLPNYIALLDENPELKPLVTYTDEDGKTHYYSLYAIADNIIVPWQGTMYRRDWVVKYAKPTPYVWDWESDYTKENGHPKFTPLSVAEEMDDYTGWKENEVTEFTSSDGENPENDYTDNVIFPSGKTDPYTISDWEWMFEAFQKAIDIREFSGDSDAYCTSLYFPGFMSTGDLVSSFGGGGPQWYLTQDGEAAFGGESENFKTYIEAMNNWHEKGWLDTKFETRASDMFWEINSTGVGQGKVGLWVSGQGLLGATIRATSVNEEDQKDAMVFGTSLPINDVYGNEDAKYIEPYTLYQQNVLGTATGFTTKCEEKDIETLFAMLNYLYSKEGGLVRNLGLNENQYTSMEFEPDLYEEIDINAAYTTEVDEDGNAVYKFAIPADQELTLALKAIRMGAGLQTEGDIEKGYTLDRRYENILNHAIEEWTSYKSTGYILDYNTLMDETDSSTYNKIHTYVNDYMEQAIPDMIKNGLNGWDNYTTTVNKYAPNQVTDIYQNLVNQ